MTILSNCCKELLGLFFSVKMKKTGIIDVKGDTSMNTSRIALFILVSMFLAILELTVDPTFYFGRIFLGLGAFSMVTFAVMFVRQYWRLEPVKVKD